MKQILVLLLCATFLYGCGEKEEIASDPSNGEDAATNGLTVKRADDIGDLEQAVSMSVRVSQNSVADNIVETPLIDAQKNLNLLSIDVSKPYPEKLLLDIFVKNSRAFTGNPGVLRFRVMDGENERLMFTEIIGEKIIRQREIHTIDVLATRESIPETMLITIDSEALLMPTGTPEEGLDPLTAETSSDRYSTAVATPPIRINFVDGPQEAATDDTANTSEG